MPLSVRSRDRVVLRGLWRGLVADVRAILVAEDPAPVAASRARRPLDYDAVAQAVVRRLLRGSDGACHATVRDVLVRYAGPSLDPRRADAAVEAICDRWEEVLWLDKGPGRLVSAVAEATVWVWWRTGWRRGRRPRQ
jgi:hypothetical protein